MKRLIAILCALVVLAAGGATAYAWHEMASIRDIPRDAPAAAGQRPD